MAVIIGSARIDERGKASGGNAGDQTGKEVSTQNWYKHSKGWRVLEWKDPTMAEYCAQAMRSACDNNHIGYDQSENKTLWNQVSDKGYDPAKATKNCETDCARLVRVCVQYALTKCGISKIVPDFYTASEASTLLKTGYFIERTGSKYTDKSDYLKRGVILVTRTKGHTVIVLTNGSKAEDTTPSIDYKLGDRLLKNGMEGSDVKELQQYLIQLGYSCGSYGADGDFGDSTEQAVKNFQKNHNLTADGEYGDNTHTALMKELEDKDIIASSVQIVGGSCYIRSQPNTSGSVLSVAKEGDKYEYANETTADGWNKIKYGTGYGWVSGKYSKLV